MASYKKLKRGWQYRITYRKTDGTQGYASDSGFSTKKEAQYIAEPLEKKLKKGIEHKATKYFFHDYFSKWIKLYKLDGTSKVTMQSYIALENQIKKYFGDTLLSNVTRDQYQSFLKDISIKKRKNGKTLYIARATLAKKNSYIRSMVQNAMFEKLIETDFTYNVVIPVIEGKTEDSKFLYLKDFKRLNERAEEKASLSAIAHYIVLTMSFTGLRFGEALGLTWDDVNFEEKTLDINKTWRYKDSAGGFGPTKNKQSVRIIGISDKLLKILKQLKKEQSEYYLKIGYRDEYNLVFRNKALDVITNDGVNGSLKRSCASLGIKRVTTHALRHTHGSVLLYNDISIFSISKRLGHENTSTTIKKYLHVINELETRENENINKALEEII